MTTRKGISKNALSVLKIHQSVQPDFYEKNKSKKNIVDNLIIASHPRIFGLDPGGPTHIHPKHPFRTDSGKFQIESARC